MGGCPTGGIGGWVKYVEGIKRYKKEIDSG